MAVNRETKPKAKTNGVRSVSDLPHVRHENYSTIYANFAQCALTPWDISIIFSELGEAEIGTPAVIDRAAITITPQLAKALVGVITANLRSYEAQFGEIQMPRGLVAPTLAEPKPKPEEKE
ncbi:MAG: DUF3467 domain-containing protein [Pyrinomonadaceae bacterium]